MEFGVNYEYYMVLFDFMGILLRSFSLIGYCLVNRIYIQNNGFVMVYLRSW